MKFFLNYVFLEFISVILFLKNYLNLKYNIVEVLKNFIEVWVNFNRCYN